MAKTWKKIGIFLPILILVLLVGIWQISKLRTFQFFGEIYSHVPTEKKWVALTFDDGPNPQNTPQVLALLKSYNAKGTFFMIGENIEKHEALAREVLAAGHELANHSYSHQRMLFRSFAFVEQEIEKTDALIRTIGFQDEILFRPPFGKKFLVLPYVLARMRKKSILWDVEVDDTQTQDADIMIGKAFAQVRPGSIILMHDGGAYKAGTMAVLEALLKRLTAEGYSFVGTSQLLAESPRL